LPISPFIICLLIVFGTVSQGFDCIIPDRRAVRSNVAKFGDFDPPTSRLLPSLFSCQLSTVSLQLSAWFGVLTKVLVIYPIPAAV